jgi:CRP-like cAMP-binding protein
LAGIAEGPLTGEGKIALASIATIQQFDKGTFIHREREKADFLYVLLQGVVKTFTTLPDGSNRAVAFYFPDDLFGWSEDDRYAGSGQALAPVSAYKIPVAALEALLRSDAELGMDLLRKFRHRMQQQHDHLLLLGRNDALGRVAMFIAMLEQLEHVGKAARPPRLYLPMSRSDIADFVGLSLEAVSRAFTALEAQGVVTFRAKRHFQVTDRAALLALIDNVPLGTVKRRPPSKRASKAAGTA